MIDLRLLIKNGVHFGHQRSRWCPKMKTYIWGFKNDIHLIDVAKTAFNLEQAAKFVESVAAEGKTILLVGTKKAASEIIEKTAIGLNLPYVAHRWVGGTFSNFRQVRKSIANMLRYEEILEKADKLHYTKKELSVLKKRVGRLQNIVGGIRNLAWPVGAVVLVDVKKEHVVVKEAKMMGIPVVGLVDTNSDPADVDYVIPANDDAPRSISVLMAYLAEAIRRGQELAEAKPKDEVVIETLEMLVEAPTEEEEEKPKKIAKKKVETAPKKKVAKPKVEEKPKKKAEKKPKAAPKAKPKETEEPK